MSVRFIPIVACNSCFCFFCFVAFHCMMTSQLISSPFDGKLDCSQFGGHFESDCCRHLTLFFGGHYLYLISVGNITKSEVAESYGKCIIMLGRSCQFSKVLVPFYTFNRNPGELQWILFLPVFSHFSFFSCE